MGNPHQNIRSPLKFLDPYQREDGEQFFGREEEVNKLYESVNKNRLVLVYGQSGTGKTSLVKCGLANRFEVTDWMPFFIRRGRDINESLYSILGESKALGGREVDADNVLTSLERISTRYLRPVYLIFDQFEELLILKDEHNPEEQEEEIKAFIELVKKILNSEQAQSVHLLFIIREEYFAALDQFEKEIPQFTQRRLRVEPMRPKKLKSVILETCHYFNIELEEGEDNAEQILDNLKIKGGIPLPYLQVYLDMLWREDYQRTYPDGYQKQEFPPLEFTTEEIAEFGEIKDVLDRFLSEQTERIQLQLQREHPDIASDAVSLILDAFTTTEGTKLPIYYRLQEGNLILSQRSPEFLLLLPNDILVDGLDELEKSRILRKDDDSYELAHDTLAEIIDKRRTDEQRRRNRLRRLVRSNYELNQPLTLGHLAELEEDLPKLALTPEQAAFVEKSRRMREEEQKEVLKKAQKRRNQGILFGLFGLILVGIALWQFNEARIARKEAQENLQAANEAEKRAISNENRALKNKESADSLTLVGEALKARGDSALAEAAFAQRNLSSAAATFFTAVTEAVDGYIYTLEYEKALKQLRLASIVALSEGTLRNPKLGRQLLEMAFFYNEIGQSDIALGLADTTFQLLNRSDLRYELPTGQNSGNRSVALNELLKQADTQWYNTLQGRYYPKMIFVEGKAYEMGSTEGDADETPHTVTVSDFLIAETETTVRQFYLFARAIGLDIEPKRESWGWNGDFPMHGASWFDAIAYAQWMSLREHLQVAHDLDSIPTNPNIWYDQEIRWDSIFDLSAPGYRLPTEAEWEYAAKGGVHKDTFIYSGSSNIDSVAWYFGNSSRNSSRQPQRVKAKKKNSLNLYDMSGNVYEWCWDRYDGDYYSESDGASDPRGPAMGSYRVFRGGCWRYGAGNCRAANRDRAFPDYRYNAIGFRLARNPQ